MRREVIIYEKGGCRISEGKMSYMRRYPQPPEVFPSPVEKGQIGVFVACRLRWAGRVGLRHE